MKTVTIYEQPRVESIQAACEALRAWQSEEQQVCPIPVLWVALAESVGLIVDLGTGTIVEGPEAI
jgi:EAL domain-containing protein (putative c-di-GMP-specific phosphodiesterase class I)